MLKKCVKELAQKSTIIGRNPSMVIPLLANQDLTPMLPRAKYTESTDSYGTYFANDPIGFP